MFLARPAVCFTFPFLLKHSHTVYVYFKSRFHLFFNKMQQNSSLFLSALFYDYANDKKLESRFLLNKSNPYCQISLITEGKSFANMVY